MHWRCCNFALNHQYEMIQLSIIKMGVNIIFLKFHSYLTGIHEFKQNLHISVSISLLSLLEGSCGEFSRIAHNFPLLHIEAWRKWHTFCRQHFQMHFFNEKFLRFNLNFTEVCSQGSDWQWVSTGSGNGKAPNRWQAITWTSGDPLHWHSVFYPPSRFTLHVPFLWCLSGLGYP